MPQKVLNLVVGADENENGRIVPVKEKGS